MRHILRTIVLLILLVAITSPAEAELYTDGFVQGLFGGHLSEDNPAETDYSASETRLQLRFESISDRAEVFSRVDFRYDGALDNDYDFEIREAYLKFRLSNNFDFKVGRQILTWGTGDYLFINDVFAKDYRSFFIGRDDQYLKAPQTALRMEWYNSLGNLSVVFVPRFEGNRLPTGRRLSYFNPMANNIVGTEMSEMYYFDAPEPESKIKNGEIALRLQKQVGYFNTALYYYHGFYKNPLAMDPSSGIPFYPELDMYGASIRGALFGGIIWGEIGYLDSKQDPDGDLPNVPNSSVKAFAGFERQIATDFTANIQWQVEYMLDHDLYASFAESTYPSHLLVLEEARHLLTSRLTKKLDAETITLSAFGFFSPTDEDMYLRLSAEYKYSDEVTLMAGLNLFEANYMNTDFGQNAYNDNIYLKMTYGF